jgi:hypothetical protein
MVAIKRSGSARMSLSTFHWNSACVVDPFRGSGGFVSKAGGSSTERSQ